MTYAVAQPLQAAVFTALQSDPALTTLVGGHVYDAVPQGTLPDTYVRIGAETVTDASDGTGAGAMHRFIVSVITTAPGFSAIKEVAGAVSDALHDADLPLSRGRLIFLKFERAVASREDAGASRQVDVRFRARVEDD